MDLTCTSCGTKLKIPDSKLPPPQVRMVSITCPKCKSRLKIDRDQPGGGLVPYKKVEVKAQAQPAPRKKQDTQKSVQAMPVEDKEETKGPIFEYEYDEDISPLEFYEEGTKLALVLNGDAKSAKEITSVLEELTYRSVVPSSIREAMGKLLFHHFDLIILSDGFDGLSLEDNPVINYLNSLSMSVRRRIFLALISKKFKTMDLLKAFGLSANMVINTNDLVNLSLVLKKGISDNEKFYKVFMDSIRETGKD